jgi:hypothetical protein
MPSKFAILEEVVPELIGKDPEEVAAMWRNWMNMKAQDDVRMLILRPLSAEDRKLIQLRFFQSWQSGKVSAEVRA